MAITFEIGKSYWMLTAEQYADLQALMDQYGGENFLSDFEKVGENYYATKESIDENEYAFLEDWGLLHEFNYIKSTQNTSVLTCKLYHLMHYSSFFRVFSVCIKRRCGAKKAL